MGSLRVAYSPVRLIAFLHFYTLRTTITRQTMEKLHNNLQHAYDD